MNQKSTSSQGFLKNKKIISFLLVVTGIIGGLYFLSREDSQVSVNSVLGGKEVTVYKTPTCGCCNVFVSYLKKKIATVKTENLSNLDAIKKQYGVPSELASCHTSVIDGYVVEGHIPAEAIEKLLLEKPNIKGIALPGMPSGTPGMPGPKTEKWEIRSLNQDGTVGTFMTI
jgi:hypothetical protein